MILFYASGSKGYTFLGGDSFKNALKRATTSLVKLEPRIESSLSKIICTSDFDQDEGIGIEETFQLDESSFHRIEKIATHYSDSELHDCKEIALLFRRYMNEVKARVLN